MAGLSVLRAQPRLLLLPNLRKLMQLRRPLPLLVQLRTARRALDATRGSGAVLSAPLGTIGALRLTMCHHQRRPNVQFYIS